MQRTTPVPTGAVATQLPGVKIVFQSKPPYSRFDILVSSTDEEALGDELAHALVLIGFNRRRQHPSEDGMLSQSFECEGSGLCGGWTAAERDKATRDARNTLRRFGFSMVPEIRS